jgi:hypothetical protein
VIRMSRKRPTAPPPITAVKLTAAGLSVTCHDEEIQLLYRHLMIRQIWRIYRHNFFLKIHSHSYTDSLQQHPIIVNSSVRNLEVRGEDRLRSMQIYLADSSIAARIGETFVDLYATVMPCKSRPTCALKCQMEILNIVVYERLCLQLQHKNGRSTLTSQVPPFLHVSGWHSIVSWRQFLPSKPGGHAQE